MSDSSSITGATNPAGLPEKFSFSISHEEAKSVLQMAIRYAPEPSMGYRFQVQFGATTRRWLMREQNIIGFTEFPADGGPTEGYLSLTINVLEFINELFEFASDTTINIDFTKNQLSIVNGETRIDLDLPSQGKKAMDVSFTATSHFTVETKELAHLGRALDMLPISPDMDDLPGPFPFIEFSFANNQLTARRDWSVFDGPVVAVTIPARGSTPHDFASYPNALPRELFFSDCHGTDTVQMCFSEETPNIAFLNGETWGIRIELGTETVHQYRGRLVHSLSENLIDVDQDERIGWSPIVNCHHEDTDVSVEIVKGIDGQDDYFRLSTVVLPDSPWNLEIASEINDWNNQWTNVKLVRHETDLVAIRDIAAEELELTSLAVIDLVEKSKVVAEVVGVFI